MSAFDTSPARAPDWPTAVARPPAAAPALADSRYAAKGGALQLLFLLAQAGHSLFHVLLARMFGVTIFGLYVGAYGIIEVATRLGIMGADKALYRFVAGHREAREARQEMAALGTALKLTLFCAPLVAVAVGAFASAMATTSGKPQVAVMLPALAPMVIGAAFTVVFVAAAMARRAAGANIVVRGIFEPLLLVASATIAFALGAEGFGLGIALSCASLATAALAFAYAARVFGMSRLRIALRSRGHGALVRLALPLSLLEALNTARQQADGLVLLALMPLEQVALYKASDTVGRVVAQVRVAFDGIAAPLMAAPLHAGDRLRLAANLRFLTRWVASLTLPVAVSLAVLRMPLLALFGSKFLAAGAIVITHVVGHTIVGVFGVTGHVLIMGQRVRWALVNQLLALAANLGTCAIAVPRWGMTGALAAFVVGVICVIGANMVAAHRLEGVHAFHVGLAKPFCAAAVMVVVQFVAQKVFRGGWPLVVAALALGLAGYALTLAALGWETEERAIVARLRERSRRTFS